MQSTTTHMVYGALVLLCGSLALAFNPSLVSAVHSIAELRVRVGDASQEDMTTPKAFIESVREAVQHSHSLSAAEKAQVVQEIPASVDYEHSVQGPYEHILDFSLFDSRNRRGGILLLGDSSISWGFSISHFAALAQTEVHALTYGRNLMDGVLLAATDRIVNCYYDSAPTVIVSASLRSISKRSRPNFGQDRVVRRISRTKNCEELYELVARDRSQRSESKGRKRGFRPQDVLNFRKYRSMIASMAPKLGRLRHVQLHEMLEPDKFEERRQTNLYFYRWQPEFRLPFKRDSRYWRWRSHDPGQADEFLFQYTQVYGDRLESIADMHKRWSRRNACFILPLAIHDESTVRNLFLPDPSICRIDFREIANAEAGSLVISMESEHHLSAVGGVVFASVVGKYLRGRQLPTWRMRQ